MNNLKLCPVCNKLSRVRKQSVRVKGKLYCYLIYVHDDGSQHRTPELSESPKISLVTLAGDNRRIYKIANEIFGIVSQILCRFKDTSY